MLDDIQNDEVRSVLKIQLINERIKENKINCERHVRKMNNETMN